MKTKLLHLAICLMLANSGTSQIFKFKHILTQANLNNARFVLIKSNPTIYRPEIRITSDRLIYTFPELMDTISTNAVINITGNRSFQIKSSLHTSSNMNLLPGGAAVTIVDNVLYNVPANTSVTISANSTAYVVTTDVTELTIRKQGGGYSASDQIVVRSLSSNIGQLIAPTKGIITVGGGKIFFDPWRITVPVPTPPAILNPVDQNTVLPLELRDGRRRVGDPTRPLYVPYRHITISVNSIPFRYRARRYLADTLHSTGTVTTAFSLAVSVGHTWGYSAITTRARNDYAFTLGMFFGPSSVDLKMETVKNPALFTTGRTNPVLSYGINGIFSRNGLGVLLAVGMDNAFGKHGRDWIYNNQPWFGIGVGASFPK